MGLGGQRTTAILRLDLLRSYKLAWLPGDLSAGIVIFAVTIPTALAYGHLAGLQPINGLYASLLAMAVYAFFGTSRQLIIDAEAAVAIVVFTSVAAVARGRKSGPLCRPGHDGSHHDRHYPGSRRSGQGRIHCRLHPQISGHRLY